jgi:hypothetical protein
MDTKKSVFISHASKDAALARQVSTQLEAKGVPCWIAPRDIQAGKNFNVAILSAIENCTVMLLILSEAANQSDHVMVELERAFNYKKVLIPLRVREVLPSKKLEYFISSAQWVDAITSPLSERLDYVSSVVKAIELDVSLPDIQPESSTIAGKALRFWEVCRRNVLVSSVVALTLISAAGYASIQGAALDVSEIKESVSSIDSKMNNVKKETSDNPRKELANRGISWQEQNFTEAIKNSDVDTVNLFLQGGMPVRHIDAAKAFNANNNELQNLLIKHKDQFNNEQCKSFLTYLASDKVNSANSTQGGLVKSLCTTATARLFAKENLDEATRRFTVSVEADASIRPEKKCIAEEMTGGGKARISEAYDADLPNPLYGSLSNRALMLWQIRQSSQSTSDIAQAVAKYCSVEASRKSVSMVEPSELVKWRNIVAWIS